MKTEQEIISEIERLYNLMNEFVTHSITEGNYCNSEDLLTYHRNSERYDTLKWVLGEE